MISSAASVSQCGKCRPHSVAAVSTKNIDATMAAMVTAIATMAPALQCGGGVLEAIIAPEQILADGDGGNAEHTQLVGGIGGGSHPRTTAQRRRLPAVRWTSAKSATSPFADEVPRGAALLLVLMRSRSANARRP